MTSDTSAATPTALERLDDRGRHIVFTGARTVNSFSDQPVTDEELKDIYELVKWTPTAANVQPLRVLFVRTPEGKERLLKHMADGNRDKTEGAPVTAVLAYDTRFHEHVPTVFPINPGMADALEANEDMRHGMGNFSAAIGVGAFILATRAAGLAAGPMAGFDKEALDADFFADGRWKSLLVVNIGHPGAEGAWFDRLPRLEIEDAVSFA
ncbi:MAG: malonic semialdehyde reductase [Nocardioidaceae bacterium]|nr:malonic semialdehyde reductase [Nocardioidaceae bacterium]MCL2612474.1 malonic semialdehyde reductase [Nocardioidaceae bacterium]